MSMQAHRSSSETFTVFSSPIVTPATPGSALPRRRNFFLMAS
jgi:hypothetical protein